MDRLQVGKRGRSPRYWDKVTVQVPEGHDERVTGGEDDINEREKLPKHEGKGTDVPTYSTS